MTPQTEPDGASAHPPFIRNLALALAVLRKTVDVFAITLLSAMTLMVIAQILGRYVFDYAISWSEEIATFVQVWLVMLGAGIAMRYRQHVGIDVIIARCPLILQRVVKATGLVLAGWFLIVVIIGSMSMMTLGMIVKSPALQVPLAVPYLALPVGMAYFLIELIVATVPEVIDPASTSAASMGDFE